MYGRPPAKMAKVKAIVDESSMFSVLTPSVAQLTEALKSAENWTSKVASMLVCDYAFLSVLNEHVCVWHASAIALYL